MRNLAIVSTSLGIVIAAILLLQLNGANAELDTTRNRLEAAQAQNEQLTTNLAAAREQLDGKTAENVTLTADLSAANTQLGSAAAEITGLRSELKVTKERLTAKTTENETLTADLQATTERLTAKAAESETLTADLEATTERLTAKTAENETLTADLATTTEHLTTKTAENATLTADLATTTEQLTTKTAQLSDKTSEHQALTARYETLTTRHEALIEEAGELEEAKDQRDALVLRVDSLTLRAGNLQQEIAELERRREPLIVDSYTRGFKCTGSMEPKITCLDTATWLTDFYPEDIVIGAVISFTPTAACELGSGPVAHRVMSVRRGASGDYYYWPKGDANSQDDGCWIPHTNVNGYMIELLLNTNLENSGLRNRVNTAKAAWDEARQNYEQKRLEYCGSVTGACTLSGARYNEVIRLLNIFLAKSIFWEVVYREASQ